MKLLYFTFTSNAYIKHTFFFISCLIFMEQFVKAPSIFDEGYPLRRIPQDTGADSGFLERGFNV